MLQFTSIRRLLVAASIFASALGIAGSPVFAADKVLKIGVLGASDKFGQEGEAALQTMAPKFGLEIVAKESFDPNDVDMTVQITKVAGAKPGELAVSPIGPVELVELTRAMHHPLKAWR